MRNYLELLQDILDNGKAKGDRTGTGTLSVFGRQLRWDLSEGFPLITTKKMYTRGVIGELLWFIEGSTNARYLEEKWGVKFWREWADEDGELGPIYGQQLRNIKYNFWVKPKIRQQDPEELIHETEFDKKIEIDFTSGHSSFLGKTFDTESGKCTVIKELDTTQKKNRFVVKFHETGYEKVVDYGDVQRHKIADPFATTVFGVGRYGLYEEDEYTACLKDAWREMLRRCYYEKAKPYKFYGARGVHVSKEWLTFANFNRDARELSNWSSKIEYPGDYSLDKDVRYASNYYSKDTCMWSSREEQSYNMTTNKPFTALNPQGEEHLFNSIGEANVKHGLNLSAVHRCLNGELHIHHGWHKFNYINREGEVLRARIIDQLKELVAEIKHNPDSRRLVISLYNPHELDKMNLQPCHGNMIQFYVADNKLSCSMYQRSADMFLGVPVNIASYSLLTHIIAQQCNLEVGEFIWSGGDVHIYNDHMDQVKEQLTREPYPLPQLHIKRKPESIDDYVYEDFEFIGYKHHPAIKAPVSV